jgi:hypothetical protein
MEGVQHFQIHFQTPLNHLALPFFPSVVRASMCDSLPHACLLALARVQQRPAIGIVYDTLNTYSFSHGSSKWLYSV